MGVHSVAKFANLVLQLPPQAALLRQLLAHCFQLGEQLFIDRRRAAACHTLRTHGDANCVSTDLIVVKYVMSMSQKL